MKSKRLLSLLLTAALAVTSLPAVAATPAPDTEAGTGTATIKVGDDLLEGATLSYNGTAYNGEATSNATPVADDGHGGTLQVTDRYSRWYGLNIIFDVVPVLNADYYVTFDIRGITTDTQIRTLSNVVGDYGTGLQRNYWKTQGTNLSDDGNNYITGISVTTWKSVALEMLNICDTKSQSDLRLCIVGGPDGKWLHPFEIDNVKLYTADDPDNPIAYYTFDGDDLGQDGKDYGNVSFTPANNSAGTVSSDYAIVTHSSSMAHTNVNAVENSDGKAEVIAAYSFDNLELTAGTYDFSGSIKYDYFDGTRDGDPCIYDNTATAYVTATIDNEPVNLGSFTIGNAWSDAMGKIVINKSGTLSGITVKVVNDDAYGFKSQTIDFKNFSLVCTELFSTDNTSDVDQMELIDIPEYEFVDADGAYIGVDRIGSFVEGNKYLRMYNRHNNWDGLTIDTSKVAFESGKEYYLAFDMRTAVDVSNPNSSIIGFVYDGTRMNGGAKDGTTYAGIKFNTTGVTSGYYVNQIGTEKWIHFEIPYTQTGWLGDGSAATTAITNHIQKLTIIGQTSGNQSNPFDFDNIEVYYYDENGDKQIAYSEYFEDDAVGALSNDLNTKFVPRHRTQKMLLTVEEDAPYYTANATSLSYAPQVTLEPGVYYLNAQFAYPHYEIGKLTLDGDQIITNNANCFTVGGTVTVSAGEDSVSPYTIEAVTAGNQWVDVQASFIVNEPSTLDEIEFTFGDTAVDVMMRNVEILYQTVAAPEAVESDNLIDNATATATGAIIGTEIEANSYLYVAERTSTTADNFLVFDLPVSLRAGRTYYASVDLRTESDSPDGAVISVRPKVNIEFAEKDIILDGFTGGITSANTIPPAEGNETNTEAQDEYASVGGVSTKTGRYYFNTEITSDWSKFVGQFTPKADQSGFQFTIHRGPGPHRNPISVDNVKIWYMNGETPVVVYANNFESGEQTVGDEKIKLNYTTTEVRTDSDYSTLTPIDGKTAEIAYDVSALGLTSGDYEFSVELAAAQADAYAQIVYTLSNGDTVTGEKFTLTDTFSTAEVDIEVGAGRITGIKIVTNVTGELMFRNVSLIFVPEYKIDRMPNIGIIMMMLYKKQGGAKVRPVKTEFIENGDLAVAPVIFNEAAPKVSTVDNAGWYAKNKAEVGTTLTYVTEGDNSFIRVTDLDQGQRGVFWNTGVTLQPGTYTFTMDVRVSETAESAHYTEYTWRDAAKNTMQIRANLGDPNGTFSPHFAAFDPVDLDSPMNAQGQVYGNCQIIKRDWYTYTDTIVIDEPILAVFKIGGGTGGEVDAHGFDIDNLSIIGYVNPETGAPIVEEKTEPENLIVNGDFAEAPTVIEGDQYNQNKTNAWFQNNGMDYDYDENGKAITSGGKINHDQKITWADGYITVSGREFNLRHIWFNTGLTLQPGTYELSIDFKTANKDETSSVRVSADGIFSATVQDAVAISNEWVTKTINFTVSEAKLLKINIYGGPGAGFTQDYCIDNVVLIKK